MYPGQRQATLRGQSGYGIRNTNDPQRRASTYADPNPGSFSAPVARLSKWPKNVFFASDFIAEKAAAATSTSARRRRPRRRTCSTDARKAAAEAGCRTTKGVHEPTGRHRISKDAAARRPPDSKREGPQSTQGCIEHEKSRPDVDVARGEEEGTFLEESASALLLLYSRFFGGVSREEDIVCRLCMLCREAGWMGNPLRACPDLDSLGLEKMVVARLRSATGRRDVRWQRKSASGHSKNKLSHPEEALSFEAFYRILADIATLVYPRERKAMQRLLLEGVLPLAANNEPRVWSPRPELLYGRPALSALRMQRGALHQLYCSYENIARTDNGSGGISRGTFLKMLSDLGVTPVSVSEQHAASVFHGALRNGLAGAEPPFARKHHELRKETRAIPLAGEGHDNFMEVGNRAGGVPFSSSEPWGDRLCWSSFLEAMAALAVGAVKEGHATATATTKGRNKKPLRRAGNWSRANLERNFGEPGEDTCEARQRARSPGEGRYPERRVPSGLGAEFDCRSEDEAGGKRSEKKEGVGRRGVPSAGGRARADSFSERDQQATYGGSFYHDSRREVELMPTLREFDTPLEHPLEHPGSPACSQPAAQPPSRLQQTPQGHKEVTSVGRCVKLQPTDTRRKASQPSPTAVTTRVEGGAAAKARHFGDTASRSRVVQNIDIDIDIDDQERRTAEYALRSVEHLPLLTAKNENKNKKAAREAGESKNEATDRAATSTATAGAGCSIPRQLTEVDQIDQIDQIASRQVTMTRPKGGSCTSTSDGVSGRATTARSRANANVDVLHGGTATEVVDKAALSGQELIGLSSKRRGALASRNATASNGAACAHVQPVSFSLKENENDGGQDGERSPAPCHGGSLFTVQVPSARTPAASEGLKGPPCRASSVLQGQGNQPARPLPGLESHAADESVSFHPRSCQSTGLVADTPPASSGGRDSRTMGTTASREADAAKSVRENPSTLTHADDDQKIAQKKLLNPGWGRDGLMHEEGVDGNRRAPLRDDCSERREEGLGDEAHADDVTMSFEAASATIFDVLLEPSVVAVYSSHRKELLKLFQRYYSVSPDGERFKYMSDSGIWRFVGEFPVLARWAEDDSILRLIIRASRDRGWHHCRKGGGEAGGQSSGLTYFGFLEVLTRMAYASGDRSPLHRKLLALISSLKLDDPRGILRF